MWHTLTVEQVQKIDKIRRSAKEGDTVLDVNTRILSVTTGKPESEIDSLSLEKYRELCKTIEFLEVVGEEGEIVVEGGPANHIQIGKKRYRMIYKVEQMPFARYIEGKTFAQDFTGNLHKLAASMVIPQRKNWLGRWVDDKYNASLHEQYANDLKQAPFSSIYHSCLFFYHVYRNWMEISKDFLVKQITDKGISQPEAEKQVDDLLKTLDGFTTPRLLPNLKG